MPIKTILLSLTTPEAAERVIPVACAIARRHEAHLIGLHTIEAIAVYPGIAVHVSSPEMERFNRSQEEQADAIRTLFEDQTKGEDFPCECRIVYAQSMTAADQITEHSRAADLVIMSQEDPDHDRPDQARIQQRTIRRSGRPVLVIPYAGTYEDVGRNALIGWSPTREAARAAHDAIPLIKGGEATILTAHHASDHRDLAQETAKELALCYDRHGINATVLDRTDDGMAVGGVLLNESFERGCDLIVTGAFGHSRMYDFVIGATTTFLLKSMTAPVLFSS